jgi:hypothetical protein
MAYFGMEIRQPFQDRNQGHGRKTLYSTDSRRFLDGRICSAGISRRGPGYVEHLQDVFTLCVTLADICTVDGKAITLATWQG